MTILDAVELFLTCFLCVAFFAPFAAFIADEFFLKIRRGQRSGKK